MWLQVTPDSIRKGSSVLYGGFSMLKALIEGYQQFFSGKRL